MQVRGTGEATQRTGTVPAKTGRLEPDGKNSVSGEGKREREKVGRGGAMRKGWEESKREGNRATSEMT